MSLRFRLIRLLGNCVKFASAINNAVVIVSLLFFCLAVVFLQKIIDTYTMDNNVPIIPMNPIHENKDNPGKNITTSNLANGSAHQKHAANHTHMNGDIIGQRPDNKDHPNSDHDDPIKPSAQGAHVDPVKPDLIADKTDEISHLKNDGLVHHVRPSQDPNFEEDEYKIRVYTPETVTGSVIETFPGAEIVDQNQTTTPPSEKFVKVSKHVEEEEEEEEDDGEVGVPLLNRNRLQILRTDDGEIDISGSAKVLVGVEKDIFEDSASVIVSFIRTFQTLTNQPSSVKEAAQKLEEPKNDRANENGQNLANVALVSNDQFKPIVLSLMNDFLNDMNTSSMGSSDQKLISIDSVIKNFSKTAKEIFRDGFTWSRLLTHLLFSFDVFVHLCAQASPKVVQDYVIRWPTVANDVGVTSFLANQNGWVNAKDGITSENPRQAAPNGVGAKKSVSKECGCIFSQNLRPSNVLAAAGALLAAGAAFYYYQRN